jgi:transposase
MYLTTSMISCIVKGMRYTIKQFQADFPNDDVCLETIFQNRYGDVKDCPKCGVVDTKFYRVKGRKCYACMHCGYQLHPLAQTIFHKSETPLTSWFYAIYLFSVSKNGVASKELERHLGVTYKTAHRMARQIRKLMAQDDEKLTGIVEADETFIGGQHASKDRYRKKAVVIGATEKYGSAKAIVAPHANATVAIPFLKASVASGSTIHTDESSIYSRVKRDYDHKFVRHHTKEYVKDGVHTNSIEGLWGQMKRSIDGTYHCVSPKYLQHYVNEFVFRYNFRDVVVYPVLLEQASKPSL